MTLTSTTTTSGQSGPGTKGNEEVLHILPTSKTGDLRTDGLLTHLGYTLVGWRDTGQEGYCWHSLYPQLTWQAGILAYCSKTYSKEKLSINI